MTNVKRDQNKKNVFYIYMAGGDIVAVEETRWHQYNSKVLEGGGLIRHGWEQNCNRVEFVMLGADW